MARLIRQLFLLLLFISATQAYAAPQDWDIKQSPPLAWNNLTLIDGVYGIRIEHTIVFQDGKITAIGPTDEIELPNDAIVQDGSGHFAIPGLWDAHVHLTFDESLGLAALPLLLANGITSIRDTGGQLAKIQPVRQQTLLWWHAAQPQAPRMFFSGPLLDGRPRVYSGEIRSYPEIGIEIADEAGALAAVAQMAEAGADFVKVYEMLSPTVFKTLLQAAQQHNLKVASHMPLSLTPTDFATSGVKSLEHMRNLEMACSAQAGKLLLERRTLLANPENKPGSKLRSQIHSAQRTLARDSEDKATCDAFIQMLAKSQMIQVPTLALNTGRANRFFATDAWQANFNYLPAAAKTQWLGRANESAKISVSKLNLQYATWSKQMVKRLHAAGVPIMAGTDMPILYLTPGFSLHLELERLVEAGLTPLEAISAATLAPAQFFGWEATYGALAVGKMADMVVLKRDPSTDITATRDIKAVIAGGRLLFRQDLDRLLELAKTMKTSQ
ncbi:MAG: amidohydrolase family protein [Pseudomonadota bacterium]